MAKNAMFTKSCVHCGKTIPSTIAVCPYCHRDEKGQDIAESPAALEGLEGPVKEDLKHLNSDDPLAQKNASDRLCQKGSAVVPWVIQYLNEHTQKGAREAVRILGRLRDRRSVNALIQALKVGDEATRVAAVWALSQLNDPQALEELLRECDRNNPTVQGYLAHKMSGYPDARVFPMLTKLAGNANREVSFQGIWALGEAGQPLAIYPLRRQLGRRDPVLKAAAATALRRLGGPVRRTFPKAAIWIGSATGICMILGYIFFFYR